MERYGILHTQRALQQSTKFTTRIYTDSDKAAAAADLYAINKKITTIEEKIDDLMAYLVQNGKV